MKLMMAMVLGCATQATQDGAAKAKAAIQKVADSGSYKVKFTATVTTPGSDPVVHEGETVRVKGGVLFIYAKASGGAEKRIVRVGNKVWVYHEVAEDWVDAAENAAAGAGRGVQNPDEVLDIISKHLEKATLSADGNTVNLKVDGGDIEKIMKEQTNQGAMNYKESSAEIGLALDGSGRVAKFSCAAHLASTDPALKGKKVEYVASVEVQSYDQEKELKFTTKKGTEIPLNKEVAEAVKKATTK